MVEALYVGNLECEFGTSALNFSLTTVGEDGVML